MAWTEAQVAELKRLKAEGQLSYSQIAEAMTEAGLGKFTRNAVTGKLDRLGLTEPLPKHVRQKRYG